MINRLLKNDTGYLIVRFPNCNELPGAGVGNHKGIPSHLKVDKKKPLLGLGGFKGVDEIMHVNRALLDFCSRQNLEMERRLYVYMYFMRMSYLRYIWWLGRHLLQIKSRNVCDVRCHDWNMHFNSAWSA